MNPETAEAFSTHIRLLEKMAIEGNEIAIKSLACMVLLLGDDDDGTAEVVELFARAA